MSGDAVRALVAERAALRRVATLVAGGTPPDDVFAAVVDEVGRLLRVDLASICRYEAGGTLTWVAAWGRAGERFPVGTRRMLGGTNLGTIVFDSGRSARIDDYAERASGPIGVVARAAGITSSVAAPIMVEGRLWGMIAAGSSLQRPLPADTEAHLASFTELVATALANAESRAGLARLADEQAALRRVATLVAGRTPPEEVFAAVTEEAGRLLRVDFATLGRYESDRTMTIVAAWGETGDPDARAGEPHVLGGRNVSTLVFERGRAARIDDHGESSGPAGDTVREVGVRAAAGTPIIVEGRLWGMMAVGSLLEHPLPADTDARLASFTELLASAIANAESRAGLARLADEQAALRHVATLVACGAPSEEVFGAVVEEVGRVLPVEFVALGRYEAGRTMATVAVSSRAGDHLSVGSRWPLGGRNVSSVVFETGRAVRIDDYADASGSIGAAARGFAVGAGVGAPISVEGRLWGVMAAYAPVGQPLPVDAEARLANFTELLATAIANSESRVELTASRARIVAAADDSRRRIERDLHDGTQQRLVSLLLELRAAHSTKPADVDRLTAQLAQMERRLAEALEELGEISRGIHPAILSEGGLPRALGALALRSAVPVELHLRGQPRLPERVEVAAYYVVSEALTNAAKHARASVVHVDVHARDRRLRLAIRDDGVGGADVRRGSGLVGLSDRIEALGGTLQVSSPTGSGTTLRIEVPLDDERGRAHARRSGGRGDPAGY